MAAVVEEVAPIVVDWDAPRELAQQIEWNRAHNARFESERVARLFVAIAVSSLVLSCVFERFDGMTADSLERQISAVGISIFSIFLCQLAAAKIPRAQ